MSQIKQQIEQIIAKRKTLRLPQIEKEIVEYLRKSEVDLLSIGADYEAYLSSMDTIVTDHGFTSVCVGAFNSNEIDNLLRLCASHYRYAFQNNVQSYPYFS